MPDSGEKTVTEYRLRLRNGAATVRSERPREGETYHGRTAREQIEMMAKIERDYRRDPGGVTIQVSHDGGESWEPFEETPPPDRSVSVVVDEGRAKAAKAIEDWYGAGQDDVAKAALLAADYPAMVERQAELEAALAVFIAPYDEWDDAGLSADARWAPEVNVRALRRGRAVLGGEVQGGSDRSDVAEALEHVWAAREALRRGLAGATKPSAYLQGFIDEADGALAAAEKALNGPPASTSTTTEETSS